MGKKRIDIQILIITLLLVAFGLLMLFSASFYIAQTRFGDGYYYVSKQILGAVIGLGLMIFFALLDYHIYKKFMWVIYFGSIALLALVWVPGLGQNINGAQRWIKLSESFNFQPSEVSKFGLIIVVAAMIDNFGALRMKSLLRGILPILIVAGGILVLIVTQPNFSVFTCVALTTFAMLLFGGMKLGQGLLLGTGGIAGGALILALEDYRELRVQVFMDPWANLDDGGYQLVQSLYALASGGVTGTGLGQSRQKFLFLPYGESDFIFAIIAEEWGLVGAIVLLGAFFYLIARGFRVAMRAPDTFGSLLAAGITFLIALQVIINVAVVTSSIPPTGLPLPFISAGTTSIIAFLAAIGILLNISRAANAAAKVENGTEEATA